MKRTARWWSALAVSAAVLGGSLAARAEPIVKAIPAIPQQLDHQTRFEGNHQSFVINELASTLLQSDVSVLKDAGCGQLPDVQKNLRPNLAESWSMTPDGKAIEFRLRRGVMSPYGNEMTAEDVKWSIDRGLKQASVVRFLAFNVNSFEEDPVEIVDPYTVRIRIKEPTIFDFVVFQWTQFQIYDSTEVLKHATADDPLATGWLAKNSADFGPWKLTTENFEPGTRVTMVPNENYWDAANRGNADSFVILAIPDSATRSQLLRSGEIDFAGLLTYEEYADLRGGDVVDIAYCLNPVRDSLLLNYSDEHLANPKVRQAISMAIDRQAIVDSVFKGFARPAATGIHSAYGIDGLNQYIRYDVEQAKALMKEAGYENGFSMKLTISPAPIPHVEAEAVFIVDMLRQIGINVELEVVASGTTFQERFFKGEYQSMIYLELPAFPDPFYSLNMLSHGKSFQNSFKYRNERYDELVTEGLHLPTENTARRSEMLTELMNIMAENPPQIYLIDGGIPQARSKSVSGWEIQLHSAGNISASRLTKQ